VRVLIGLALALGGMAGAAQAQAAPCCTIAAETAVRIEIVAPVSSRSSRTGQLFAIRLAEPILVDGRALVPAGAAGIGEVVHAARRGGGGTPGELILAARYLDHGGVRIALHKLRFARSGADGRIGFVVGYPASYLLTTPGGHVDVPAGTILQALVAAPVTLPAPD